MSLRATASVRGIEPCGMTPRHHVVAGEARPPPHPNDTFRVVGGHTPTTTVVVPRTRMALSRV
jgi:hypothetical protein